MKVHDREKLYKALGRKTQAVVKELAQKKMAEPMPTVSAWFDELGFKSENPGNWKINDLWFRWRNQLGREWLDDLSVCIIENAPKLLDREIPYSASIRGALTLLHELLFSMYELRKSLTKEGF